MSAEFFKSLVADFKISNYFSRPGPVNKIDLCSRVRAKISGGRINDLQSYRKLSSKYHGNQLNEILYARLKDAWLVKNIIMVLKEYEKQTGDQINNITDLADFKNICAVLYRSNKTKLLPDKIFYFVKYFYAESDPKFDDIDFDDLYKKALVEMDLHPSAGNSGNVSEDDSEAESQNQSEDETEQISEDDDEKDDETESQNLSISLHKSLSDSFPSLPQIKSFVPKITEPVQKSETVQQKETNTRKIIEKLLRENPKFIQCWKFYNDFLENEIVIDSELIMQYLKQANDFNESNISEMKVLFDNLNKSVKISEVKDIYPILYIITKDYILEQPKTAFSVDKMIEIGIDLETIRSFI